MVTNLTTQVQNRIDNLSGTETLEQLLVLRKAADNLSLDLTDIEAAISAKIAALDGSSDDESLLIANRAASLSTDAGGATVKLRSQIFTANGIFTPPAGVTSVYVSGIGGGGGGGAAVRTNAATTSAAARGGNGGEYVTRALLSITPLAEYEITIGVGGAGAVITDSVSANQSGTNGGDTSFGSLLVLIGGTGGNTTSNASSSSNALDVNDAQPLRSSSAQAGTRPPQQLPVNITSSAAVGAFTSQANSTTAASGGAVTPFSAISTATRVNDGQSGANNSTTNKNGRANTGEGGGAAAVATTGSVNRSAAGGDGGSGVLIVEWYE